MYSERFCVHVASSLTISSRMAGCVWTYFTPDGDLKNAATSFSSGLGHAAPRTRAAAMLIICCFCCSISGRSISTTCVEVLLDLRAGDVHLLELIEHRLGNRVEGPGHARSDRDLARGGELGRCGLGRRGLGRLLRQRQRRREEGARTMSQRNGRRSVIIGSKLHFMMAYGQTRPSSTSPFSVASTAPVARPEEQTVLDDAGNAVESAGQRLRLRRSARDARRG